MEDIKCKWCNRKVNLQRIIKTGFCCLTCEFNSNPMDQDEKMNQKKDNFYYKYCEYCETMLSSSHPIDHNYCSARNESKRREEIEEILEEINIALARLLNAKNKLTHMGDKE